MNTKHSVQWCQVLLACVNWKWVEYFWVPVADVFFSYFLSIWLEPKLNLLFNLLLCKTCKKIKPSLPPTNSSWVFTVFLNIYTITNIHLNIEWCCVSVKNSDRKSCCTISACVMLHEHTKETEQTKHYLQIKIQHWFCFFCSDLTLHKAQR